jgi:hypothetical protein
MIGIIVVLLTTVACGGGGSAVPNSPGTGATSAPTQVPVAQSLPPVSAGGITANLTVTANGTLAAQATTTNPSGITALALRRPQAAVTGSPLLYITFTSSNTTITQIGGSFTLASVPTQPVFLAFWNPANGEWDSASTVAATVATVASVTTATFATITLNPQVAANPNAYFALYTSSGALPTPTPSPTATPTTVAGNFVDTACAQAIASGQDGSVANVASTFFTTIIPAAHTICLSAWDLSNDIDTALEAAARNGASVTVITPFSENSSNATDLAAIMAAGGNVKTEYTGSSHGSATPGPHIAFQQSPMDIHAKFALVDGIAYMDGHNWFTTDVVMRDKNAADFAAIQADLTTFPTPPASGNTTSFTTDKQVSLMNESLYLQQTAIPGLTSSANEYDFITESFNPNPSGNEYNDDVYDGMCHVSALAAQPTMHVMVEEFSGYSSAAQTALQSLILRDPNAFVHTESAGGLEKISMIRSTVGGMPSSAWFGSSNATTTDLFDWGMNISDTGMLSALQGYFDAEFSSTSSIPTAAPGTTPAPCASFHP